MNEKSDEPTKQPSETSQPEAQEQPEYRKVSPDELKQILEAHQKWLESDEKEGKQADLRNANLQGVNLGDANLQKADLTRADLQGADLTEVKGLSEATLQNANLDEVTGLLGSEFARADVTGTKLPEDIRDFKVLQVIEETSKNARKIFLAMLLGCVYSWLTIATTTDARLLTNSASSPLPIIQTEIPIAYFYWVAPFILIALYVYLHFYLQRLWKGLAGLPAIFPDGKSLDERAYPWLLNGLVRRHFERLKKGRPLMAHLEEWVTILLAWWIVPLTLIGFWLRYLPRHEWGGTWIHVGLIVASVAAAVIFYRSAARTLRGTAPHSFQWKISWQDRRTYQCAGVVLVTIVLSVLSLGAINGVRTLKEGTLQFDDKLDHTDVRTWVPWAFGRLGYNTFAYLREVDVSIRPPDYWRIDDQERRDASVKGANLRRRNLTYADAFNAFLANADLTGANLQGATLKGADLRKAILTGANLQGATLGGVDLEEGTLGGADLEGANLIGANLQGARLVRANLVGAKLQGADLIDADLEGANLFQANLQGVHLGGANLFQANLEQADLTGADLEGANLFQANLQGVHLTGANLEEATLIGANLEEADLDGANLEGAVLDGAELQGAVLDGAKLEGADLTDANLQGTKLRFANLQGAKLRFANLQGAVLEGANLEETNLEGANLEGTVLDGAELQGADLSRAKELTQEQLNQACGDAETNLPPGLSIKPCPDDSK